MALVRDNCKDCKSSCEHAGKNREFICPKGISCKIVSEPPQTNGDRIRAMGDEELAKFLLYGLGINFIGTICTEKYCDPAHCPQCCFHAAMKWLRHTEKGD